MDTVNKFILIAVIGFITTSSLISMEKEKNQSVEFSNDARKRIYYPLSIVIQPIPLNVIRDEIRNLHNEIIQRLNSGKLSIKHRFSWGGTTIEIGMNYEQKYAKRYTNSEQYLRALSDFLNSDGGKVRRLELYSKTDSSEAYIGVWYANGGTDYDSLFYVQMIIPDDYSCQFENAKGAKIWSSHLHPTMPTFQCTLDRKKVPMRNLQDRALDKVIKAYREGIITLEQLNEKLNPSLRNELPMDIKDKLDKEYPPKG